MFEHLCVSYGIKRKPTTVRNPQANAILERVHQVIGQMLRTAELDMAKSVVPDDVDVFIDNAAWAIRSTYHTVLKASPCAAIFGRDMLFDIPFLANWNKIGDYRQSQTDRSAERENNKRVDYDPKLNTTNEYNHAMHVRSTKVVSNHQWMMFSKLWSCFNETQDPTM